MKASLVLISALLAFALPALGKNPTEEEKARITALGDRIERITIALKQYRSENEGRSPQNLRDLVPRYLETPRSLALPHLETSLPPGIDTYLAWLPDKGIPHPDDPASGMIAFTPSEIPAGGRFIIDSHLVVWWLSEGAFQDWLFGRKFDEGNVAVPVTEPASTDEDTNTESPRE